ncbi:MAG: methyltransferase domain-containing protein [Lachnospiraceae bacterium]|nr:methyltransferase domain-containing protein [Lachnospiraceae bacterium]
MKPERGAKSAKRPTDRMKSAKKTAGEVKSAKKTSDAGNSVKKVITGREAALKALIRRERTGGDITEGMADMAALLDARDAAFAKKLAIGTVRRQITLDAVIDEYASMKTRAMKPVIRVILRLGVYQILYVNSVRAAAAVDEAVKQAKDRRLAPLSGFVNGVLRAVADHREDILTWIEEAPAGIRYGMPKYPLGVFLSDRGIAETDRILEALDLDRPVTVRTNRAVLDSADKLGAWEKELCSVCEAAKHVLSDRCFPAGDQALYTLSGTGDIRRLPGYEDGAFTVMDASGVLAVLAAGIKPGDKVLDMCAAPGSKALFAASLLYDPGQLTAWDVSEKRLDTLRENAGRLRLERIRIRKCDGTTGIESIEIVEGDENIGSIAGCNGTGVSEVLPYRGSDIKAYDVVLCDAPCTGFGVMGRKPDIRFNSSSKKTASLIELQRKLLMNAASLLKSGGTLIYSTCTINRRENEGNVKWLAENSDLIPAAWETGIEGMAPVNGCLQIMPGRWDTDGFFIARLVRKLSPGY